MSPSTACKLLLTVSDLAQHCSRPRCIGWCKPAAAEFVRMAVRLSGLNCIH